MCLNSKIGSLENTNFACYIKFGLILLMTIVINCRFVSNDRILFILKAADDEWTSNERREHRPRYAGTIISLICVLY